jgi:hypothetical protein
LGNQTLYLNQTGDQLHYGVNYKAHNMLKCTSSGGCMWLPHVRTSCCITTWTQPLLQSSTHEPRTYKSQSSYLSLATCWSQTEFWMMVGKGSCGGPRYFCIAYCKIDTIMLCFDNSRIGSVNNWLLISAGCGADELHAKDLVTP